MSAVLASYSMKPSVVGLLLPLALVVATEAGSNSTSGNGGQAVIVDTDLMSDVDDVGSLAVVNVLHNCGLADLRGVVINTHSRYGALAANVRGLGTMKQCYLQWLTAADPLHILRQQQCANRRNTSFDERDVSRYLYFHVRSTLAEGHHSERLTLL